MDEDISSIDILSKRFDVIVESNIDLIDKINQLIDDCKKFGTLAFAHAARAGFVAVTLLKSLIKHGTLSKDRMLEFQGSISTVASDFQSAISKGLSFDELIKKFGHLRPGTYDVNQYAYWENQIFISLATNKITKPKKLTTLILFLKRRAPSLRIF